MSRWSLLFSLLLFLSSSSWGLTTSYHNDVPGLGQGINVLDEVSRDLASEKRGGLTTLPTTPPDGFNKGTNHLLCKALGNQGRIEIKETLRRFGWEGKLTQVYFHLHCGASFNGMRHVSPLRVLALKGSSIEKWLWEKLAKELGENRLWVLSCAIDFHDPKPIGRSVLYDLSACG